MRSYKKLYGYKIINNIYIDCINLSTNKKQIKKTLKIIVFTFL